MALELAQRRGGCARIGRAVLAGVRVGLLVAAAALPAHAGGVLVISPHPDDDILTSAGVILRAHQQGDPVRVVFVTNGDFHGQSVGFARQAESVVAQAWLGTPESDLIFLGYPDAYLDRVFDEYTTPSSAFATPYGQSTTYGNRGLGGTDYHTYRFGAPGNYNRSNLIADLADILATYLPTHIFVTSEYDVHRDHSTANRVLVQALGEVFASQPGYNPTVHETIVWPGDLSWPRAADARTYHAEIPTLWNTPLHWSDRESLDVPLSMQTAVYPDNPKYQSIAAQVTQGGTASNIGGFIHKDEFFWPEQRRGTNRPPVVDAGSDQTRAEGAAVTLDASGSHDPDGTSLGYQWVQVAGAAVSLSNPASVTPAFTAPTGLLHNETLAFELKVSDGTLSSVADLVRVNVVAAAPAYGPNIAPQATVTASTALSGQQAIRAVDGIVDGHPGNTAREWAAAGTVGSWIQLDWSAPRTIGKILLYDRINPADRIMGGTLSFSDGSVVLVGPLLNSGSGTPYTVPPRTVTSVRLTVDEVAPGSIATGLAEIEAFEPGVSGSDNAPPVIVAGADQEVDEGGPVLLDGSMSYDPEGLPLGYNWTQIGGPVVALSSPGVVQPSFTAPTGIANAAVLTFRLSAHDGIATGGPDEVAITAYPTTTAPGNVAAQASVTASSQNAQTGQLAIKAVDAVVDGWPSDPTREWATLGERAGAWIQSSWTTPQTIDRIVLYDRPNSEDHVLGGTLAFSDGSTLAIGPLNNAGFAVQYVFAPKAVTHVRLTIDSVSAATLNSGLSELEVFVAGTGGSDGDGDGVPDSADCAPGFAGAWAVPGEVSALIFKSHTALRWNGAPQAHVYDLYRGVATAGQRLGASHGCLRSGLVERQGQDVQSPAAGQLYYYVVAGRNRCGAAALAKPPTNACPLTATDTDRDGVADVDDLCAAAADPGQVDTDHDLVGNVCDNCPQAPNASQADGDSDNQGDACDRGF